MRIWFHGTDVDSAELIGRNGFIKGTYFAAHLEDALVFGGEIIFEVALECKSDSWQICVAQSIPLESIVSITRYHKDVMLENEDLRKTVFDSNR
jgi:hypothetical protein